MVGYRKTAFETFEGAIGNYELQRNFFNGSTWQELWPQLAGTDQLHLLQTEDVAIYEYPENEQGQTIFACVDPVIDPLDVSEEHVWLALTVNK